MSRLATFTLSPIAVILTSTVTVTDTSANTGNWTVSGGRLNALLVPHLPHRLRGVYASARYGVFGVLLGATAGGSWMDTRRSVFFSNVATLRGDRQTALSSWRSRAVAAPQRILHSLEKKAPSKPGENTWFNA